IEDALQALRGAVAALPDVISDPLNFDLPGKLTSAFAAVKGVLAEIEAVADQLSADAQNALAQLRSVVRDIARNLPSVQTLAGYLADALGLQSLLADKLDDLQGAVLVAIDSA